MLCLTGADAKLRDLSKKETHAVARMVRDAATMRALIDPSASMSYTHSLQDLSQLMPEHPVTVSRDKPSSIHSTVDKSESKRPVRSELASVYSSAASAIDATLVAKKVIPRLCPAHARYHGSPVTHNFAGTAQDCQEDSCGDQAPRPGNSSRSMCRVILEALPLRPPVSVTIVLQTAPLPTASPSSVPTAAPTSQPTAWPTSRPAQHENCMAVVERLSRSLQLCMYP